MRLQARALCLSTSMILSVAACGDGTVRNETCGPKPAIACTDDCGNSMDLTCRDGEWSCPAVTSAACTEFGPMPGGEDCLDACGNFEAHVCVDGSWRCPEPTECTEEEPDPPSPGKEALWSDSFGSDEYESLGFVAMGEAGAVYVAFHYRETLELDPGVEIASSGGYDAVVVKYDAAGNRLWHRPFDGAGDDLAQGLEVHPDGSVVFLVSSASTTGTMDAGEASLLRLSADDGATLASQSLGFDLGSSRRTALAVQPTGGAIVVAGHTAELGAGETDVFVSVLDAAGETLWSRTFGGASYDYLVGLDIDAAGRVFASGTTKAPMTVDGVTLAPEAGSDGFVLAFSPQGKAQWGTTLASPGASVIGDVKAYGDGGAVVTATFEDQVAVGGEALSGSGAELDALVARLDPSGGVIFAHTIAAARSGGSIVAHRGWLSEVDASGDILLAGSTFADSMQDTLLARLDPVSGDARWLQVYDDDNSNDVADLAAREGEMAIAGAFFGGLDLGNGALDPYTEGAGYVALLSTDAPESD